MGLFTKVFGTYSDRQLKKIDKIVCEVEALADKEIRLERRLLTPAAVEIVSERVATLTAPSPIHCGDATLCKTVK